MEQIFLMKGTAKIARERGELTSNFCFTGCIWDKSAGISNFGIAVSKKETDIFVEI